MSSPAITIGPRVRKSPFYEATVKAGAQAFTIYNHMFMPTSYGDTTAEYWTIVKGVSLWDVAAENKQQLHCGKSRLKPVKQAQQNRAYP